MKKKFSDFIDLLLNMKSMWVTIFIPVVALGVFFFMLTLNNVSTETYDIERFNYAKETIRSPITIENEQETKRKTRETVQSIEDRYDISQEITDEQIGYTSEIFDAIGKLEESDGNSEQDSEGKEAVLLTTQEKVQRLQNILSPEITEKINDSLLINLLEATPKERQEGKELFITSLSEVLNNGVRTENVQSATAELKQKVKYSNVGNDVRQALIPLSEFAVVENSFFDVEKTMDARKEAASSVEPVIIRAGEIIVREGQTITNEIYEELKLVGLLNKERNVYPLIGLALLIVLVMGVIFYEMYAIDKRKQLDKGTVASILLISFIVITLMKVVSLFTTQINQLFFIVPAATGALLLKQLINERIAIVLAILYAILGSIIFNGEIPGSLNIEAGIYFFFSQIGGIIFLMNVKDRLAIVKAGLGMAAVNIITVFLFLFLSFEKYSLSDLIYQSGFGFASAILSAVLTIGLLPFFETGLGILSDIKLLSLSSANQPLLRKILTEAPGTYHHSIMVANLSETACEAIGANGLLARVGAYYHDIGKTVRPHYFIENQLSIKNPHDVIEPRQSAEIIINHPYDGANMLKKHRLPKEIIDIALQHHGTTLLKFFYYKEKETNKHVKESDFRYPGPKPQTKEAAIVCICDSVEAAVRSLKEPTEQKIEEIVSSIINDRLMDGQLNESPLTMKELHKIHKSICETLKGIFHSRIQYPMKEAK
ncbi:HD family phosphohydrolase [Virgibacillus oceani]|uniref:Cyclic-di-AMP phosphodiesterase PgpH n=1 Tax=Virgibacillus oceani TaxID=1479511 RepID=A0A917H116_9BACI|nr:HD family phosphohydrolase [Virgibacillus oceani]GGG63388.1 cyclic-di-AMP phosphodiesterase PgpH [Virgibacillus oceani]